MITDFVIPKNNEFKFVKVAKSLGFQKIVFCYLYDKKVTRESISLKLEKVKEEMLHEKMSINLGFAILVKDKKDINKAKKITNYVIFNSIPSVDLRAVLDQYKPSIVTNLEFQKFDFVHHRASGINQVIGKILNSNNTLVSLSIPLLFSTKYKAEVLGRMSQNIFLARKFNFEIKSFSFANTPIKMKAHKNMVSLISTLGATVKDAKNSFEF